jgi:hypothetical protein
MELKSVSSPFIDGPGIATNGVMTVNTSNFTVVYTGGSPDTARSKFITGYYKYIPMADSDTGFVQIYLFKRNGANRDTIGQAYMQFYDSVMTYTQFMLDIVYKDYINQPDSCLIIFQSSLAINSPDLAAGTKLLIDSLNFSGYIGVNDIENVFNSVNIYPVPASNELSIDASTKNNISVSYEIYDTRGRIILTDKLNSDHQNVDISNLSEGNYIVKLKDSKNRNLYSKNITIAR